MPPEIPTRSGQIEVRARDFAITPRDFAGHFGGIDGRLKYR
jgi:hypothetical protein